MLSESNTWFLQQDEAVRDSLLFLREQILNQNKDITEKWRYGMPFYFYKGKRFCYLWVHKKLRQPYVGFVDGNLLHDAALISENRSRMKIFLIDPTKTIPVKKLNALLKSAMAIYA